MKYSIEHPNLQEFVDQLNTRLSLVEVKGDSVMHLCYSRQMLKDLFSAMQVVEEKTEEENK